MSYDFDGVDDRIALGSGALFDNAQPMTVAAWIAPDSYGEGGNFGRIVCKETSVNTAGAWSVRVRSGQTFAFVKNAPTALQRISPINAVSTGGVFQHVAVTWNGSANTSGTILYVNGTTLGQGAGQSNASGVFTDASQGLNIGNNETGANTFEGRIAHVHMYRRVLSREEILSLMSHPAIHNTGVVGVNTTGLIGYWPLGGFEGAVIPNQSGNGFNGVVTGAVFDSRNPSVNETFVVSAPGGCYAAC